MNSILTGWPQIVRFFHPNAMLADKLPVESWAEWCERKGWELAAQGMPVFFMPELDDLPRAAKRDLLQWAKNRSRERAESIIQAVNMETAREAVKAWQGNGESDGGE